MITVIIAGGSGTRLWPLSTSKNPKQLLSLTGERTMVQQAFDRAEHVSDKVYVVTESSHALDIKMQLPELPEDSFLVEPGRRGTAHCILMALDFVARNHDKQEPIAFIHADHHIRDIDGFKRSIEAAAEVSKVKRVIALVGIEPTYPATGFGYIERGELLPDCDRAFQVESFKEKPDFQTAQNYVEAGNYLWNCGYFVGSVEVFVDSMQQFASVLKDNFEKLALVGEFGSQEYHDAYLALDNQVIDTALIEKADNLAVIPASFDWMDIGNFKDLHDIVTNDEQGNFQQGEQVHAIDVTNTYIRNEEADKPVAVIGLDNVVVVNTPDGVLVARKDVSPRAGEVAKKLQK